MENKNDVPEGHDPAAGQAGEAGREAPSTSDADVPEFLKGPDPDEVDESGDARTADARGARDDVSGPAPANEETERETGMDRDAWEAEFSSTPAAGTADASSGPASGQHAAVGDTGFDDGEAAPSAAGAADREETPMGAADPTADTAANATTEAAPDHTRALPTWDQDTAAGREAADPDGEAAGNVQPAADAERDHEPVGATATVAGAGAGAGAGAMAASSTPTATESRASDAATADAEPADSDAAQRTDAVLAAKRRGGAPRQPGDDSDPEAQRRQKARDAALTAKPRFARVVQTVLAIFFPFLLLIGAIRAVASPWFLWLDYHRPGFPVDAYGFSPAERLTYGNYGVDYINNSAPSAYLGNLVDGKGDPLFLGTEVSHMADVKSVIGITYAAGIIMAILAVIICLYLGRRYAGGIRRAFFAGSVITLVAMIALTVLAVLNFATFFTDFHELFFAQGNWTFHANDTLIRLYPTQFWMDAGIVIAGLVLLVSLVFLITNWPTRKRRERSRLRQSNRDLGLD